MSTLPTYRGLEDAAPLAQRAGTWSQHAPPHHQADLERPDLDLQNLDLVDLDRRGSADDLSSLLRRWCRPVNLTPTALVGESVPRIVRLSNLSPVVLFCVT